MIPQEIYRHDAFYRDAASGEFQRKYLVVLARIPGDDLVVRLLTSKQHGRPEDPRCYHGYPYPGFYLGIIGEPLPAKSWVDLRYLDDFDPSIAPKMLARVLARITSIAKDIFAELLDCVGRAEDTTKLQERAIRDQLARMSE